MNDTIYREDAIEAVSLSCRTCLARNGKDCEKCSVPKLRELINVIPSADRPQGEWIPVAEGLPGFGEDVLISVGGYCNVGYIVQTNDEYAYNWYYSGWYHDPNDVDAWMELPEPWKGADDE